MRRILYRWFPWRFVIRRVARAKGFLDPLTVWSYLRRFAQPSDVGEPIELLRAGFVFHARGLMNSRAIQHNLDWVWLYWVERQFDPLDDAFVPRAFSLTHVNLTHRNWTAIGLPDCPALPIVDPRGLVTPYFDGWSLDGWILGEDGRHLLPSRLKNDVRQTLSAADNPAVTTQSHKNGLELTSEASVILENGLPVCRLSLRASAERKAWLVLALRPYNPEGVSFVHDVTLEPDHTGWTVNGKHSVKFSAPTEQHAFSHYHAGDVFLHLPNLKGEHTVADEVGMATGAVLFALEPGRAREVVATVPLKAEARHEATGVKLTITSWSEALSGVCAMSVPDEHFQFLYDTALRTLVLHSPGDVFPGPYTYKRFWFRDAAFILHAMLCAGLTARAERVLDRFPSRQTALGYFHSQEGEWDSNGEALWILRRYCELSGRSAKPEWLPAIRLGARWIRRKRLAPSADAPVAGLMPAGFSAEHLGLNDYYYWDDFWSEAGLRAAAAMLREHGETDHADRCLREADSFRAAIERSLKSAAVTLGRPAMPASPYRRLDAGAIGSLAAGYPLQLLPADDPRLLDTVRFLMRECFVGGGFFQDMIHSGINPYLSLHIAQVLLRAGDPRYFEIMNVVAGLASPTGQWPEAIHPRTGGGCMGDGQHVWAAAEWVLMLRSCFVRDEEGRLILGSGIPRAWLEQAESRGAAISFGPAPTKYGELTLSIAPNRERVQVEWAGRWHGPPPEIEIRLPGTASVYAQPEQRSVQVDRLKVRR